MSNSNLSAPIAAAVAAEPGAAAQVFRKIAWRLMPLITIAYIVNFLDRINVGFAALTMNRAIGLTHAEFGIGAGILFLGYTIFELPSNIALHRVGARIWLSRIMISWGIVAMAAMFVVGARSFYLARFLLGMAEAGFFPGAAFYLSEWFPVQYRARIFAWFLLGIPVASVIGGPVSGALLHTHGFAGIAGWQWLYLIEGAPAVVIGLLMLGLKDKPEQAGWLTGEEKRLVRAELDAEVRDRPKHHLWAALSDFRVVMIALIQFTFTVGAYGVAIFLPMIIKAQHFSNLTVGWIYALPSLLSCVVMVLWAGIVDRSSQKMLHLTAMCLISGLGLVLAVYAGSFPLAFAGLTAVVVCTNAARAVLWTIPTRFLAGLGAAAGLAFINSIGTVGGFVGPSIMGWLRGATGSFDDGLLALSGFMFLSVVLILVLRAFMIER